MHALWLKKWKLTTEFTEKAQSTPTYAKALVGTAVKVRVKIFALFVKALVSFVVKN
jgi:hypothetical protein